MKDSCEDEVPLRRTNRRAVGRPKKMDPPAPVRIPRIARLMALAIKFQGMVERGEARDYADLARLGFITRARMTQIMNLLLLSPKIQEALLCLDMPGQLGPAASERDMRAVVQMIDWTLQEAFWGLHMDVARHTPRGSKPTCCS